MDKKTLKEYKDTIAMIYEWNLQLVELENENRVKDVVKSSMAEFPFAESHATIEGYSYTINGSRKRIELQEKIERAKKTKAAVEEWMDTLTLRQQRIVKYKILEGLTWREVADKVGCRATEFSVRKEYDRMFKVTNTKNTKYSGSRH